MTNLPSLASSEPDPQVQAQLNRLLSALETVQQQFDQLDAEVQHSGAQIDALTQHLTGPDAANTLLSALSDLSSQQQTLQEQLTALEQSLARLSRTQFKANALAETEQKQLADALSILQGIVARRETIQTEQTWRDQRHLAHLREQARVEFAVALLPVLDGLEAALDYGRKFLQDRRASAVRRSLTPAPVATPPSLRQRLRLALGDEPPPSPPPVVIEGDAQVDDALAAWLQGLKLVNERFLALLRSENIQPMTAAEERFDPHRHVAVAVTPAVNGAPGVIIEVIRPGYLHHDRVLRFAEVVVTASSDSTVSAS